MSAETSAVRSSPSLSPSPSPSPTHPIPFHPIPIPISMAILIPIATEPIPLISRCSREASPLKKYSLASLRFRSPELIHLTQCIAGAIFRRQICRSVFFNCSMCCASFSRKTPYCADTNSSQRSSSHNISFSFGLAAFRHSSRSASCLSRKYVCNKFYTIQCQYIMRKTIAIIIKHHRHHHQTPSPSSSDTISTIIKHHRHRILLSTHHCLVQKYSNPGASISVSVHFSFVYAYDVSQFSLLILFIYESHAIISIDCGQKCVCVRVCVCMVNML